MLCRKFARKQFFEKGRQGMSSITVFFFDPRLNRKIHLSVDESLAAEEVIGEPIFADVISNSEKIYLEIIGKDRNIRKNETFKDAGVQNEDIILIKKSSSMIDVATKKMIGLYMKERTVEKEVTVIFKHPTDESTLKVTVDGTMTEGEAINELINNNFIPLNRLGYKLGIDSGRFFKNDETFIDIGAKHGCLIVIKPIYSVKVFISYAKEDFGIAFKLYEKLRKETGIVPWLDTKSLLPGQRWKLEIKHAIRDSDYFLTVLSKNSVNKRGFVQKEIKDALEKLDEVPETKVFIIPVRVDECRPSHPQLHELHWVDLFPSLENGINKICRAITSEYIACEI